MPECLRTSVRAPTSRGVPGEEGRSVAGQVGLLGQGVQGEPPGRSPRRGRPRPGGPGGSGRLGVPRRLPGQLGVALVGDDDGAPRSAPRRRSGRSCSTLRTCPSGLPGLLSQTTASGHVLGGCPGGGVGVGVDGHGGGPGQSGADVVGGVGGTRVQDEVAGAHPRGGSGRRATDSLEPMVGMTSSSPRPATPRRRSIQLGDGVSQGGGADRRRVAGRVGPPRTGRRGRSSGMGSTGVPTARSTTPSGCRAARSR